MRSRSDSRTAVLFSLLLLSLAALRCASPSDPESLTPGSGGFQVVGRLGTPGYAQDVELADTLAFVAQGEGGLLIATIADPSTPAQIAICTQNVRGYSSELAVRGRTVFIAAGDFGVSVVSADDPLLPVATSYNLNMKPARSFTIMGDYLFTAVSEVGVKIAEISFPQQPDIRGGLDTPGYARGLTVTPDSASLLVACGEMGLALHDISDLRDGFGTYPRTGWVDTPGYAEDVALIDSLPYALVACGSAGLFIVDFSDTSRLRVTGSVPTSGYAREVTYRRGRAYVAADRAGLQVFAVDDPAHPRLIGTVPTAQAYGVALGERHIYIADRTQGLVVIAGPAGTP